MSRIPLAIEAVHEAGHAVMARHLGLSLGRIQINRTEESGRAFMIWPDGVDQQKDLLILAAARGCMRAFDIDTFLDQGGFEDAARIQTILTEIFPDEDEAALACRVTKLDSEIENFFNRHDVRAAAQALAEVLTARNEVDDLQAETIIDRHLISEKENA
jgi:hypothetical protein